LFCAVKIEVELPRAFSLKEKRKTVRSLKDRLRKKNLAVVEADHHDAWQRASLEFAIAAVSQAAAEEKREELRRVLLSYDGSLTVLEWHEEFIKL